MSNGDLIKVNIFYVALAAMRKLPFQSFDYFMFWRRVPDFTTFDDRIRQKHAGSYKKL